MSIKIYKAYRVDAGDPYETLWAIKQEGQKRLCEKLKELYMQIFDGLSVKEFERRERVDKLFRAWLLVQEAARDGVDKISASDMVGLFMRWDKEESPSDSRVPFCKLAVTPEHIRREISSTCEGVLSLSEFEQWVRRKYRGQAQSPYRNEWCFDAFVNVRVHKKRYYLIPHCDKVNLFGDFLREAIGIARSRLIKDSRVFPLVDYSYWDNADPPGDVGQRDWLARGLMWEEILRDERERNYLTLDVVSQDTWIDISVQLFAER